MPHIGNFPEKGFPKPLSIGPTAFQSGFDTQDWNRSEKWLKNRTSLSVQYFHAPVILPHGARVKKLTLNAYRDDALATLLLYLRRFNKINSSVDMAQVMPDWTTGHDSGYDDTISYDVIDNENYAYSLYLHIDPNNSVEAVYFECATIDWQ